MRRAGTKDRKQSKNTVSNVLQSDYQNQICLASRVSDFSCERRSKKKHAKFITSI